MLKISNAGCFNFTPEFRCNSLLKYAPQFEIAKNTITGFLDSKIV